MSKTKIITNQYEKIFDKLDSLEKKLTKQEKKINSLKKIRKRSLSAFLRISEKISNIVNKEDLFKIVIENSARLLNSEAGSIMTFDKSRKKLVFASVYGEAREKLINKSFSYKKGISGYSFYKGAAVIVNNVKKNDKWNDEFDKMTHFETRSILCCPIRYKNKKYGMIQVVNKKNRKKFSTDDLNVLKIIAHQAGIAISNINLFQKSHTRLNEINALRNIVLSFSNDLNLDTMLKTIVSTVPNVFKNFTNFSIMLIDEETKELYIKSAAGLSPNMVEKIRFSTFDGLPGIIIDTGEPLLINDAENDKRVIQPHERSDRISSIMGAPLIAEGKVLGIIFTDSTKKNAFNKYNLKLLKSIASHISIAISNAQLFEKLKNSYLSTINVLVNSIDAKDKYTRGHSERVKNYAIKLADKLNLDKHNIENIYYASLLHDVGKIGISENIINKKSKLTDHEYEILKKHPSLGNEIIKSVEFLAEKLPGVSYHHERYDGKGYPAGLKGEKIPLEARIIAIADTFDAMTSTRSYRKKYKVSDAFEELEKCAGTQFDPELVKIFIDSFSNKEISDIDHEKH